MGLRGMLYGVGVGPGDPKLLTLKAIEVIKLCGVIAVSSTENSDKTALNIISEYIGDKRVLECFMPMTRDEAELSESHKKAAENILNYMDKGIDVCFATLGDPSIYSTYSYIHRIILMKGYETRIIPGVPSFCAAAAELNISLCEGGAPLHIIPASYDGLERGIGFDGNKVLMKSGKSVGAVLELLKQKQLADKSMLIEKCGMDGQKVYKDIENIEGACGYFSTIIVKE